MTKALIEDHSFQSMQFPSARVKSRCNPQSPKRVALALRRSRISDPWQLHSANACWEGTGFRRPMLTRRSVAIAPNTVAKTGVSKHNENWTARL
jgi:hypothetical protein